MIIIVPGANINMVLIGDIIPAQMVTVASVNLNVIVILIVGELNAVGVAIIVVGGKLESVGKIKKERLRVHGIKLA